MVGRRGSSPGGPRPFPRHPTGLAGSVVADEPSVSPTRHELVTLARVRPNAAEPRPGGLAHRLVERCRLLPEAVEGLLQCLPEPSVVDQQGLELAAAQLRPGQMKDAEAAVENGELRVG